MRYLKPSFTLPAAPNRITQERWDEIFGETALTENKGVNNPSDALRFDMSGPRHFGTPEHAALSQADGWFSDGSMAGGVRERV
jgi:hypothetical protein